MKKVLPISTLLVFCTILGFSQTQGQKMDASEVMRLDKYGADGSEGTTSKSVITNSKNNFGSRASGSKNGIVVGTSFYDLQTNSSIDDRIILNSDGTYSSVFTMAQVAAYGDRGSGYLYYDGANWTINNPITRIEPERIGWPSIGVTKSGKEIVISHSTATNQLILMQRAKKGNGAWTTIRDPNGAKAALVGGSGYTLWPRMAIGGKNGESVHLIALSEPSGGTFAGSRYKGLDGAICYSRSIDGGVTWDQKSVVLNGLDSSVYDGFNADSYAIYSKDDYVAIAVFHRFNHTTILKSADNGDTWKVMHAVKFPTDGYVLGDYPITDTITTSDNTGDVIIDNKGEVHVMFGTWVWNDADTSDRGTDGGQQYITYQLRNGLNYWKESFGEGNNRRVVDLIDQDGNPNNFNIQGGLAGLTNYGSKSINGFPSIGVDANDAIYCTFMGLMEISNGKQYNDGSLHYRHQFAITSFDGGCTWGSPMDLTDDGSGFEECVYGAMPPAVDDSVRVIYMEDLSPGTAVGPVGHAAGKNEIVYLSIPKTALPNDTNTCLVVIAGGREICPGDSVWLDASPSCGLSYKWNTGATSSGVWVKTTGKFYCEVITLCGVKTDTAEVKVPVNGQGPKISLSSDLKELCPSGSNTTLRVKSSSTGTTGFYKWNSSAQTSSDTFLITQPGTYTVEVTNCTGKSTTSITIGAVSKAVAKITGAKFLCPGDSTILNVSENPGGIYTWTKSGSSTPISNKKTVTIKSTGTYIIDVLACGGQFSTKDSIKVDVEPQPTALISAIGLTTICKGSGGLTLSASGQVGATYKWYNNSNGSTFRVNTDSVHTFDYFAYSFNACDDSIISNKINVIVNDIPVKPTISHNSGVYTASTNTAIWYFKIKGSSLWTSAGATGKIYAPTNLSVGDSVSARETANDCFSPYSNSLVFGNVGINNFNNPNAEFGVYPNPNNGLFSISFKRINSMNVEISIRNVVGQEILSNSLNLNGDHIEKINLNSVETGIYLLTITNGEEKSSQRIMVQ